MSASEMPGATTARFADPIRPMSPKASMMPQTVPKRPMKGATLGGGEEPDPPLEPRDLHRRCARERAREGVEAPHGRLRAPVAPRSPNLLVDFGVPCLEHPDERGRAKLGADGVDLGELA